MEQNQTPLPFGAHMVTALTEAMVNGSMAHLTEPWLTSNGVTPDNYEEARTILSAAVTCDIGISMLKNTPTTTMVHFLMSSLAVNRSLLVAIIDMEESDFRALCSAASAYLQEHHEAVFGVPGDARPQPVH